MRHVRVYLRASTTDQNPERAKRYIRGFLAEHDTSPAAYYVETVSGRISERPELWRLIEDSAPGDVLVVESIDRLTRLPLRQWRRLSAELDQRGVHVVSVDLPLSHRALKEEPADDLEGRITDAMQRMLLEICAAQAAADYEMRRRRQAEGIAQAMERGVTMGKRADLKRYQVIQTMREKGHTIRKIAELVGCSTTTVQRAIKDGRTGEHESEMRDLQRRYQLDMQTLEKGAAEVSRALKGEDQATQPEKARS